MPPIVVRVEPDGRIHEPGQDGGKRVRCDARLVDGEVVLEGVRPDGARVRLWRDGRSLRWRGPERTYVYVRHDPGR